MAESRAPIIIPFDNRVIFVRPLNCTEFSSRAPEVTQILDAISAFQFWVRKTALAKRRLPGTV